MSDIRRFGDVVEGAVIDGVMREIRNGAFERGATGKPPNPEALKGIILEMYMISYNEGQEFAKKSEAL